MRFARKREETDISYQVSKNFQGSGLGKHLVRDGLIAYSTEIEGTVMISAYVRETNLPSIRILEGLKFSEASRDSSFVKYHLFLKLNNSENGKL